MRLVDLLAKNLTTWPYDNVVAFQDYDGEVRFMAAGGTEEPPDITENDFFISEIADIEIRGPQGIPIAGPVSCIEWVNARRKYESTLI